MERNGFYNYADIFVTPGIPVKNDRQGFSLVALEASSFGLPVIAAALEGVEDAVVDGKNGYCVKTKDVKSYVSKIRGIYELSSQERDKLKKRVSNFTKRHFDWETVILKYKDYMSRSR